MLGRRRSAAESGQAQPVGGDRVGARLCVAGGRDIISAQPGREGQAMLTDFYVAFATVCFTLLGLWIIVV